ncbi:3-isopropylmalate dehydratase [Pseudomonas sp. LPB0260]|uniref:3-isopropylmalate dehydratase n=1 Tax=Pseudomonas sp. LPB0260 TaxID=2614442 RepID=UPI0015C1C8F7|nr:3-isopropylmalate dehydratase [Pseudomonas sp. LPB0260]QLC74254.1 3-isopropylmalate dehydratase [Pseudomonas sp. LPB0260]QLC77024.1 3-isopropylmalate dehydratase [Pseudomonas sp. LPB0260]
MRLILAVMPLLALTACSSFQAHPDKVSPVPEERLLAYQQPVAGGGELVVNRDLGMLGGGCYVAVLVDRQVAARIGVGERVRLQVPSGTRVLGIGVDKQDDTLCGMGRLRRELAVPVTPGQRQHFRIVSEAKSGFDIRPATP